MLSITLEKSAHDIVKKIERLMGLDRVAVGKSTKHSKKHIQDEFQDDCKTVEGVRCSAEGK
jgi:hypothetical protein